MRKQKKTRIMICLVLLLLAAVVVGLMCGSYSMSVWDVLKTLAGQGTKMQKFAVFQIRLPRILMAVIVALALSTAGSIFQNVMKNPLADPGMIGINAGAALFVVLFISLKTNTYYSSLDMNTIVVMPLATVIGSFLAAFLIYGLAQKNKKVEPSRLILVGIGVNGGLNALITLYQLKLSKGSYNEVFTWVNGSLWGSSWMYVRIVFPIILLLFFMAVYQHNKLDVLSLGEELATGLGVSVQKQNRILLALAVAMSAAATSVAGNIAFLGLLGPHIARKLVGPKHRLLLPAGACVSAVLLILADTASRNLFHPLEIPVGITLSIFGVPYFIYLMMKEK